MNEENLDIRWVQRFQNYEKALNCLGVLVEKATGQELDDVEQEALIQRFEYTQDLSWKVIKDFFASLDDTSIMGSKDAFQLAFNQGIIQNGEIFIQTIQSRNMASHSYNEETAQKVYRDVVEKYYSVFEELREALKKEKQQRNL